MFWLSAAPSVYMACPTLIFLPLPTFKNFTEHTMREKILSSLFPQYNAHQRVTIVLASSF